VPDGFAVLPVPGLPEVRPGADLARLIADAVDLVDGDVVVVTSKVVSKAEGRVVPGTRDDHLASEAVRLVAKRGDTQIVETRHGFVLAAAGIDASNVPDRMVALLPMDPDASARRIHDTLKAEIGVDVAVIISDTMGRPWRDGVVDNAIGAAGLDVLWDLRGQRDAAGNMLEATVVAIADELASAGDLVKGKLAATPVAVIRGFPFTRNDSGDRGARPLIRSAADDMFRLGTREAMQAVVTNSAPVGAASEINSERHIDQELVTRAIDLVRSPGVELSVVDDGGTVSATGDPLAVGFTLGRLAAALAAEGLRCTQPEASPTGATLRVFAS
jgi:coenzyme F420-0:L-glutamate ligase/coenzyme F420-1:gamma-L-glutamate ligase